jgi:hypothetical protein
MSELVELLGSLNEIYVQIILLARGLNKDANVWIDGARPPPNYQCFIKSYVIDKVKKLTNYVPLFYSITLRSFCWPDLLARGLTKDPTVWIGGARPPLNYQCFIKSYVIDKVKKLTNSVPLFFSITLRSFCWPEVSIRILLFG